MRDLSVWRCITRILPVLLLAACGAPSISSPAPGVTEAPVGPLPTVTPALEVTATAQVSPTATELPAPTPSNPPVPTATSVPTETSSPVSSPPQHIILIVADSLRADHLSTYGYDRGTSPNLDALVADAGATFEQATTIAPWTCPAVASLLTGNSPSALGVGYQSYRPVIPYRATTLVERLRAAGYYSAGFGTTYCVKSRLGVSQGFNYYDDFLTARTAAKKARAEEVNQRVLKWLQKKKWSSQPDPKPLFLFIYYFDPHVWYDPLPPYDTLYDGSYTGTVTSEVYGIGNDVALGKLSLTPRDTQHVLALYDGEISYWDHYLGQLLNSLEDLGLLEDTLLVVTADHGEMFGEHGTWTHGDALYEEMLRVPLLMRYSGVIPPGTRVSDPVQSMDLVPTILDWAGIPDPGDLQSISLRPLLTRSSAMPGRFIYSEVDSLTNKAHPLYNDAPRVPIFSIRKGDWKLIYYPGHPELNQLYQLGAESLYETTNLISTEPERFRELLGGLPDWYIPR